MSAGLWILAASFILLFTFFGFHIARNLSVQVQAIQQQTAAIYELVNVQKARGRLERGDS